LRNAAKARLEKYKVVRKGEPNGKEDKVGHWHVLRIKLLLTKTSLFMEMYDIIRNYFNVLGRKLDNQEYFFGGNL